MKTRMPTISDMRKLLWLCLSACIIGCSTSTTTPKEQKLVFFPSPPEKVRLQFLKSFSTTDDITVAKASSFETFVLGQPTVKDQISKPYGIAIEAGTIYVCDVGKAAVVVLDLQKHTFAPLPNSEGLKGPTNIHIAGGMKYIADPLAKAVFVFDGQDNQVAVLGKKLDIEPFDVCVRGDLCYVADLRKNQVVVLNAKTGDPVSRIGSEGEGPGQFKLIGDLTLDGKGHLFVTDKAMARITEFNPEGIFQRTIGKLGDNLDDFVRPKGISIDRQQRIWVIDAATEVGKIYDSQGRLLMVFGETGNEPGKMYLPAQIVLDYDNLSYFQGYAVPGATLECLVLVTNQFGDHKISVYGFGSFPDSMDPNQQKKE
jgi:DNA-binding beta-propeller fold protein YncE